MPPRTRFLLTLLLLLLPAAFAGGCGESAMHRVDSDDRFYEVDKPMLLIDRQHFGGGRRISEERRSYPYGLDLTNASRLANAEQVRIRFRFYRNDLAVDDQMVQVGDMRPGDTRRIAGEFEVPALYTGSDVELIWQYDFRTWRVDLKQPVYRVEDLGKLAY